MKMKKTEDLKRRQLYKGREIGLLVRIARQADGVAPLYCKLAFWLPPILSIQLFITFSSHRFMFLFSPLYCKLLFLLISPFYLFHCFIFSLYSFPCFGTSAFCQPFSSFLLILIFSFKWAWVWFVLPWIGLPVVTTALVLLMERLVKNVCSSLPLTKLSVFFLPSVSWP